MPWNNDCMFPHTQPFTAPSSSQSGMLTSSGKVLIQHAKSSGHAWFPFFDGIYMCNPFPSFGSETAGWKAAGSIIPIHPPAVSSRQLILPSLPSSQTEARENVAQCVGSTLFWLVLGLCHAAATAVSLPPPQPNSTPRRQSCPSCFQRASSMSPPPRLSLAKDTASCLQSTYTGPNLGVGCRDVRQGCKLRACFPNSMLCEQPHCSWEGLYTCGCHETATNTDISIITQEVTTVKSRTNEIETCAAF